LASDYDSRLPSQLQSQLMQRIRVLEAESSGRLEQRKADEELLQQANDGWAAEITALKVQLSDTQNRLQAEQLRHQEALHRLATQDAELRSLRAANQTLEEGRESAKAAAEREAYSTLLAQQKLISLLEAQRDAEAEKAQLLAAERSSLALAHKQAVEEHLTLLAECKKNGWKTTNTRDHHGEGDSDDQQDGVVDFPNTTETAAKHEDHKQRSEDSTFGRDDSRHLREISDQNLEAFLEKRRQRLLEKKVGQLSRSPQPLAPHTSHTSLASPPAVTIAGSMRMTHLYSKEGVTAVTSPGTVLASPPTTSSTCEPARRAPSSGPESSVKSPVESATGNTNPGTVSEEPAMKSRSEKVPSMSAAERAMSELSQPLQTFNCPRHTRHYHHYHHYQAPSNPPRVSSTTQPHTEDRATRFSEALKSQQEMSSRLESNVAAFSQDPALLHSAAAAAAFTDQSVQQQQASSSMHPSVSTLQQSAALRELSARVVAPPHAAGEKPLPFSHDAPVLHPAPRKLVDKKQFAFLERTSFYSGAGAVRKQEQ